MNHRSDKYIILFLVCFFTYCGIVVVQTLRDMAGQVEILDGDFCPVNHPLTTDANCKP